MLNIEQGLGLRPLEHKDQGGERQAVSQEPGLGQTTPVCPAPAEAGVPALTSKALP